MIEMHLNVNSSKSYGRSKRSYHGVLKLLLHLSPLLLALANSMAAATCDNPFQKFESDTSRRVSSVRRTCKGTKAANGSQLA